MSTKWLAGSCDCLFCQGENGRRLVNIPFEIAEASGLVEAARKGRVTVKPTDRIFVVEGVRAIGCIRVIRRRLARMCGCWVDPAVRKQGIGEMLVRHRIAYIEHHMSATGIDCYAFRKALYLRLGFEEKAGYKIGTTMLRKVVDRGVRAK